MVVSTAARSHCIATRRDGLPCGGYANESGFCFAHDPARAGAIAEARRKGGAARHGRRIGAVGEHDPVTIGGPADLLSLLVRAVNDALELENSISRARTLGYIAGVYAGIWTGTELERRVAALEAQNNGQAE